MSKLNKRVKIGDYVLCQNGTQGLVSNVYEDWQDLKNKSNFASVDISGYNTIDLLINDPRDSWLEVQKDPYSEEELELTWLSVLTTNGGSIWTSSNRAVIQNNL